MTPRDHAGRAQIARDVAQINVSGADKHGQRKAPVGHDFRGDPEREIIGVHADADVSRMTAPGCLADNVTIVAQRRLSQINDARQVEKAQPVGVAVEHAFVMIGRALEIPVQGLETIYHRPCRDDVVFPKYSWYENKALFLKGL